MAGKKKGKKKTASKSLDQYHHFIPRFILRYFQLGPVRSKTERRRDYRRTGTDTESVFYYDIAAGTLDIRPIGRVYGVENLYRDVSNAENVNELEVKLSLLEREAASVIKDLHAALHSGTFRIKRRPLEKLRKFLFIMHYRQSILASVYFQEDHPENAASRQWLEHFRTAKGLQSSVDMWLYMLRYYLDSSHSQLMLRAAEIVGEGVENVWRCLVEPHLPGADDFPAVTYQSLAGGFFLCIWEAAEGEEFILTRNGFGLWEGCASHDGNFDGMYCIHRLFPLSPRVVLVLRSVALRPENADMVLGVPILSNLLEIAQDPPVTTYKSGSRSIPHNTLSEMERYRTSKQAEEDLFTFKITKLSRSQTMAVNTVFLKNMASDAALTFLSEDCMLRTARDFCKQLVNVKESQMFTRLITLLAEDSSPPKKPAENEGDPLKLVDTELFKLLMNISNGTESFISAYDRAKTVLTIIERKRYSASEFAFEHHRQVTAVYNRFCCDCKLDGFDSITLAPLRESISSDTSSAIFTFTIPVMQAAGFQWPSTASFLDTLQAEVAVVGFLQLAARNPGAWYKLKISDQSASDVLSKLFEERTFPDNVLRFFISRTLANPQWFDSYYDRAYTLFLVVCRSGPTTDSLSSYCTSCIAIFAKGFSLLPTIGDSVRPDVRLAQKLSTVHSAQVMGFMKDIMASKGYIFSPVQDGTTRVRQLADDVIVVGALEWVAKNRYYLLDSFCRPRNIPLLEVGDPTRPPE